MASVGANANARRPVFLEGHTHSVEGCCHLDEQRLISWDRAGIARVYDFRKGSCLATVDTRGSIRGVVVCIGSPAGFALRVSQPSKPDRDQYQFWRLGPDGAESAAIPLADNVTNVIGAVDGRLICVLRDHSTCALDLGNDQWARVLPPAAAGGSLTISGAHVCAVACDGSVQRSDGQTWAAVVEGTCEGVRGAWMLPSGLRVLWTLDRGLLLATLSGEKVELQPDDLAPTRSISSGPVCGNRVSAGSLSGNVHGTWQGEGVLRLEQRRTVLTCRRRAGGDIEVAEEEQIVLVVCDLGHDSVLIGTDRGATVARVAEGFVATDAALSFEAAAPLSEGRWLTWTPGTNHSKLRVLVVRPELMAEVEIESPEAGLGGVACFADDAIVAWPPPPQLLEADELRDLSLYRVDLESGELVVYATLVGWLGGAVAVGPDRFVTWTDWFSSIAGAGDDGALCVWSSGTLKGEELWSGHSAPIRGTRALHEDAYVSWAAEHDLIIWDARTGRPVARLVGMQTFPEDVVVLDAHRVAARGWHGNLEDDPDSRLYVWSTRKGGSCLVIDAHAEGIIGLIGIGLGVLASWSHDRLSLWQVDTGHLLFELPVAPIGPRDEGAAVVELADGRCVLEVNCWAVMIGAQSNSAPSIFQLTPGEALPSWLVEARSEAARSSRDHGCVYWLDTMSRRRGGVARSPGKIRGGLIEWHMDGDWSATPSPSGQHAAVFSGPRLQVVRLERGPRDAEI